MSAYVSRTATVHNRGRESWIFKRCPDTWKLHRNTTVLDQKRPLKQLAVMVTGVGQCSGCRFYDSYFVLHHQRFVRKTVVLLPDYALHNNDAFL